MKRALLLLALTLPLHAQDLAQWNRILTAYYNPASGMDYKALKARDAKAYRVAPSCSSHVKKGVPHW